MESFETLVFLRGVSERFDPTHPTVHTVRKDRRPKDSSIVFHSIADDWFDNKFGVRYRTQAIFVTSRALTARTYAASDRHVMRILPLTAYRYCWSPEISDLLAVIGGLKNKGRDEIEKVLSSLKYREDNLKEAHDSGHEVMLFCEQYITIPTAGLNSADLPQPLGSPLILLKTFS